MMNSFADVERYILDSGIRVRVALASAQDEDALKSIVRAKHAGILSAVLIGERSRIEEILCKMDEKPGDWEIIEAETDTVCAEMAANMVASGTADLPMKGLLPTATFLKSVFNKSLGFVREGTLVSQATVAEYEGRFLIISDCAINISPSFEDKIKLINNAVKLAHRLGIVMPRVAVLAPLELVNDKIPSTLEAALLTTAARRGQIKDCIVDGPLALDNAISTKAAVHKGIGGSVAGRADILIMPDLAAGNIFTKALHYFAHMKTAGVTLGPTIPVIMCSRTDSPEDKYHTILMAVLQVAVNQHETVLDFA